LTISITGSIAPLPIGVAVAMESLRPRLVARIVMLNPRLRYQDTL
jgi:hypothetical protein